MLVYIVIRSSTFEIEMCDMISDSYQKYYINY